MTLQIHNLCTDIIIRRLIIIVGVGGCQSDSVLDALLECPDKWPMRGTNADLTSMHSQISKF